MAQKGENRTISSFVQSSIDHPTLKLAMEYFRLEDYDCFVTFAKRFGFKERSESEAQER